MKPTFKTYYCIAYEYGWMVRSTDKEGNDMMEMCFAKEIDAKSHVKKANDNEPKKYAERMANYEKSIANLNCTGIENYYGVSGRYYGD